MPSILSLPIVEGAVLLSLLPIRPEGVGSILPSFLNGPLKESLMCLFKLAWDTRVQIPLVITVAFLAFDIRLQMEINVFWEPARHINRPRDRDRVIRQRVDTDLALGASAAALNHQQRARCRHQRLQQRANELRREIAQYISQSYTTLDGPSDPEEGGSTSRRIRRLENNSNSNTSNGDETVFDTATEDEEDSDDEDDDDSLNYFSTDDEDGDDDDDDDSGDDNDNNGRPSANGSGTGGNSGSRFRDNHRDHLDDDDNTGNGGGGGGDSSDESSSGGESALVVDLEIRQRSVFNEMKQRFFASLSQIVAPIPLLNYT